MIEEWDMEAKLTDADFLRAALDQPQGEGREQFQVLVDFPEGPLPCGPTWDIELARRWAEEEAAGAFPVHIQQRTVIQTPWQDIDQQEGEQDG